MKTTLTNSGWSFFKERGDTVNIIEKPITDLIAYENNPRIHTEKQIQQIMKSITLTHGLRQPIVIDADNVVVCGHGRLLAAQRLGMVFCTLRVSR